MKKISAVWLGLLMGIILPVFVGCASGPSAQAQDSAPPPMADVPPPPAAVSVSPLTADLVRMAESGVEQDVLIAFVRNSQGKFNLTADSILYLKDEGIPSPVVTEMLNHDKMVDNTAPGSTYVYDQRAYAASNPTLPPPPVTEQVPPPPQAPPEPEVVSPPQPVVAPAPAYVSDAPPQVSYFYNDLSPYGTWVNLDGYGWCWQPRVLVINREWRPYCDGGHWVATEAGWFWQSDYSWGSVAFHYGRWHHHERAGWVWFPDTVWAPAWVVWRNEGEHCGWAPLPFRAEFDLRSGFRYNGVGVRADFDFGLGAGLFTFIAIRDFGEHDYVHRRLPPTEVTRIYNNTTIINNYVVNENHVVVNRGIPKERVEEVTHTKFTPVAIHNEPDRRDGAHVAPVGVVYKHEIKAPAAPVHMVAQKVDDRHPVVQHAAIVPPKDERKLGFTPGNTPRVQPPNYRLGNDGNTPRPQNTLTPNTRQPAPASQTAPANPPPTLGATRQNQPVNQQHLYTPPANGQPAALRPAPNYPNTHQPGVTQTAPANPPPNLGTTRQNQPLNQPYRYTPPNGQPTASAPVRTYPNTLQQPSHPAAPAQMPNSPGHAPMQNPVVAQPNTQPYLPKSFHQLGDGHTAPAAPPPALPRYQAPPPSANPPRLGGPPLSMPVLTTPKQSQNNSGNPQDNQKGK
jgi:hypothetical protein